MSSAVSATIGREFVESGVSCNPYLGDYHARSGNNSAPGITSVVSAPIADGPLRKAIDMAVDDERLAVKS